MSDFAKVMNEAVALHRSARLNDAEAAYRQALTLAPDSVEAHHNLGIVQVERGQPEQALPSLLQALQLAPARAYLWLDYVQALMACGRNSEALGWLEEGVRRGLANEQVETLRTRLRTLLTTAAPRPVAAGAAETVASSSRRVARKLKELDGLLAQGQLQAAEDLARDMLQSRPNEGDVWRRLGLVLLAQGKPGSAGAALQNAAMLRPKDAAIWSELGRCLGLTGDYERADKCLRRSLQLDPQHAAAWVDAACNAGMLQRYDESERCARQALALDEGNVAAMLSLATALRMQERYAEALPVFLRLLELAPADTAPLRALAEMLLEMGRYEEARDRYSEAIGMDAQDADAYFGRARAWLALDEFDATLEDYAQVLAIRPDDVVTAGARLFLLNYHPDMSAEEIFAYYRAFDEQFARPLMPQPSPVWSNSPEPGRRLRVGYVSADFYGHSARHFIEPLLAHHAHDAVEVFLYSSVVKPDETTARLQGYADHWVDATALDDAALAERIRADGIDVLVDLSGHTKGNRLPAFARKPAPVAVSWLGYGYTTGLSAIDWFLTDQVTAPEGSEALFAERVWRLDSCALAYRPGEGMGEPGPLPALRDGRVTFCSMTRTIRLNHRVVRVWAEILKRLPEARLRLDSHRFDDGVVQARLYERFAAHGIGPERLLLGYTSPPWDALREVDITLDCFPHNSGTTLFESLYMGIPYVTLRERPSVGRLGASILEAVGHGDWSAGSEAEYIDKAVALAADLDALAQARAALRNDMQRSPLMDEAGFARRVEAAYRGMWQEYCAQAGK